MKRILKGLIVIALVLLISQTVEAQAPADDLREGWKLYERFVRSGAETPPPLDAFKMGGYAGYVVGVWDTTVYYFYSDTNYNVSKDQLCHVVGKYLDAHPERWNEPARALVTTAILQAFPPPVAKK